MSHPPSALKPDELPVLIDAVKDACPRAVVDADHARRVERKDFLETTHRDCEVRLWDSELTPLIT